MRYTFLIAVVSCILLFGCSTAYESTDESATDPAPAVATFTDEDVLKIAADDRAFEEAFNNADLDAIVAFYAEDAVVLAFGGPPIHGRPAIREFFSSLPPVKDLTLVEHELVGFGDYLYQRGTISMTLIMPDGDVEFKGNFLVTRERQADGTWLYTNDMFSEETPPAE